MLNKLLSIGYTKGLKGYQLFQLRMRNGIAYATLFVMLCYTIIHIAQQDDSRIFYSHILYVIIALSILIGHYNRRYDLVRYIIMAAYPLGFFVSCVFLGKEYHAEYLIFLTAVGAVYLFKNIKLRLVFLSYNVIIFIIIKIYYLYNPNEIIALNPFFIPIFNLLNGLISLILIFLMVNASYSYSQSLYKKLKILSTNQEDIIAARTKEINQKTEELERSNKELKRFAYISAHDLREPLRNILGFSQLLDRSIKTKNYDKVDEYFGFINDSILRMDTITKDIVNFSELEQHISNTKLTDVNATVQQIFEDVKSIRPSTQLVSDDLPTININPKLCKELFENLIENGIIYCTQKMPEIKIQCTETKNHYHFSITDNGLGISSEYYEVIFVMFKRLQNDLKQPGSGIGLAICQKIVTGYGGKIWVESQVNQGSTFHFTFPKKS